jgi:non-specific serine/threonine protein kinase/serine/threonine-protein kinase
LASESLLAKILLEEQRPQEAEGFARQAFKDQSRTLGLQHRDTQESLGQLGTALAKSGRYEDAKKLYLDSIDKASADAEGGPRSETVVGLWYNLACLAALDRHSDEAFDYLRHSFDAGYRDIQSMRTDDDLKALRNDPRFEKLVASASLVPSAPSR